ncbi:unnamed protein product [Clavelina lepadiformis]|uniref:Uncharacterized protein n=1 Tax=Clavelina lepadiformis TaxID=159417 RepID=A0ABP0GIW3_CLALP
MMRKFMLLATVFLVYAVDGARARYDVGCYKEREVIFERDPLGAIINNLLPTCLNGGVWQHVQCSTRSIYSLVECYCAYVDTGKRIPGTYLPYYRSFPQMLADCPRKTEDTVRSCYKGPFHFVCDVNATKYVYDADSNTCQKTTGCYGFSDLNECQAECGVEERILEFNKCSFPVDQGNYCDQSDEDNRGRRYRYNPTEERCQAFFYRGCGGNANNYHERWDCERACVPQEMVTIQVKVDSVRSYRVFMEEWVVKKFKLKRGVENNISSADFQAIGKDAESAELIPTDAPATEQPDVEDRGLLISGGNPDRKPDEQVQREVLTPDIVCKMPNETGPCRAYFPRWYHDPEKQDCRLFIYGGCLPNGNNFEKKKSCRDYCGVEYDTRPTDIFGNIIEEIGARVLGPPTTTLFTFVVPTKPGQTTDDATNPPEEEAENPADDNITPAMPSNEDSGVNANSTTPAKPA